MNRNHVRNAKKKALIKMLSSQDIFVSSACKNCGIDRGTYYSWVRNDKEFALAIQDAKESHIQIAEDSLLKQVVAGVPVSTIFYLCNRAPERWKNVQRVENVPMTNPDIARDIAERKAEVSDLLRKMRARSQEGSRPQDAGIPGEIQSVSDPVSVSGPVK